MFAMDFAFTAEDEAFRAELRDWLDAELPRFLDDWTDDGADATPSVESFDRTQARRKDWQRRLDEGRWAAINWPTRVARSRGHAGAERDLRRGDGAGAQPRHLQHERHLADRPDDPAVGHRGAAAAVAARASSRPRSTGARASASPRPARTWPTCACTAILDGDQYVVNGQKTWISSAHLARWGLFLLRTDPTAFDRGAKHEGITAFIIDMDTPGIECRPIRDITGDTMLNEVFFTDAPHPGRLPARRRGRRLAGRDEHARPRAGRHRRAVDHDGGRPADDRLAGPQRRTPTRCATRSCATASAGCSRRSSSPGC